jgi:hypothetical protein
MTPKLLRVCLVLFGLGLFGMWFARAVLLLEPHDAPFRAAAGLWILGGIGYAGLGLAHVRSCARPCAPVAREEDLSLLVRRRG